MDEGKQRKKELTKRTTKTAAGKTYLHLIYLDVFLWKVKPTDSSRGQRMIYQDSTEPYWKYLLIAQDQIKKFEIKYQIFQML